MMPYLKDIIWEFHFRQGRHNSVIIKSISIGELAK
jgi:hypothetical protein